MITNLVHLIAVGHCAACIQLQHNNFNILSSSFLLILSLLIQISLCAFVTEERWSNGHRKIAQETIFLVLPLLYRTAHSCRAYQLYKYFEHRPLWVKSDQNISSLFYGLLSNVHSLCIERQESSFAHSAILTLLQVIVPTWSLYLYSFLKIQSSSPMNIIPLLWKSNKRNRNDCQLYWTNTSSYIHHSRSVGFVMHNHFAAIPFISFYLS